jgi:hypothetical protein
MRYFPSFRDNEELFQEITDPKGAVSRVLNQLLLLGFYSSLYGVVMGSYHGVAQAIASGVKVPILFALALVICFPAFFIIQNILGSKLKLLPMISVILSGFALTTAIMVSFSPIVIIFLLTGSNYYFLQLLHILVFIVSGIFGMKTVVDALKFSCEKRNVYPQTGVVVFRFWLVILAFVGIQLAWNLRPFLGDRGQPFKLFREYEGNFYAALIYSVNQLVNPDEKAGTASERTWRETAVPDSLPQPRDTEEDIFDN